MIIKDTPENIIQFVANDYPEIEDIIFNAARTVPHYKGSMQPFQAASLYWLCKQNNFRELLEIGTGIGYSGYFIASALPDKQFVTLTPQQNELKLARSNLTDFKEIVYVCANSRYYYEVAEKNNFRFDFILIDGDHKDIKFDLNWYNRLNDNGLIVFHDYSPSNSWSPQPRVYETLTKQIGVWGNPDVLIQDNDNVGMIGWVKK